MNEQAKPSQTVQEHLIELIAPYLMPLGYEIVHLEIQTQRQKVLRIFIDHLNEGSGSIGVEDCVKATKALDEPLETMPEVDAALHGAYELEISSPGLDRPLRQPKDYERFAGKEVQVHLFRPLTADEMGNPEYQQKNPKQKHFVGTLKGLQGNKVLLELPKATAKKGRPSNLKNSVEAVMIPLPLISKANLEPQFDFEKKESS